MDQGCFLVLEVNVQLFWVRVIAQGVKGYGWIRGQGLDQGQVSCIIWIRVVSQCLGLGFRCLDQGLGIRVRAQGFRDRVGLGDMVWIRIRIYELGLFPSAWGQCLGVWVRVRDQGVKGQGWIRVQGFGLGLGFMDYMDQGCFLVLRVRVQVVGLGLEIRGFTLWGWDRVIAQVFGVQCVGLRVQVGWGWSLVCWAQGQV